MPKGWLEVELSEIVNFKKGKKPKKMESAYFKGALVYLDIKAIEKGHDEIFVDPQSSNLTTQKDLVVVWDGARAGWVGKSRQGAIGSTIMALTPKIDRDFLYRFLQTQFSYIQTNHRGTGIPHVDPDLFWAIKVPLPPLAEQRRIVAKLDAVMAKVESNKRRLDKIPQLLKRFRQSVLAAAVSGKLTEEWRGRNGVAEAWEEMELRELTTSLNYGTSQKSEQNGKVPVLRMGNIQDGKVVWDDLKYTSNVSEIKKYKLENGDVLFNRTNSPELVGKTAIYRNERPAIYAGYIIRIKTNSKLNPEFLNLCLNTIEAREWCNQVKTDGVSQSNINAQKLATFRIHRPPIEEQEEIVRIVIELFAFAEKLERGYAKAKAMMDQLPQSILAKAFRGELVEQDPDDEAAGVLLERIRAEKSALVEAKKGKSATATNGLAVTRPPGKKVMRVKRK